MAICHPEQVVDEGLEPVRAAVTVAVSTHQLYDDLDLALPNQLRDVGLELVVAEFERRHAEIEERAGQRLGVAHYEGTHRPRDPLPVLPPGLPGQPEIDQAKAPVGEDQEIPGVGIAVEAAVLEVLLENLLEGEILDTPGRDRIC